LRRQTLAGEVLADMSRPARLDPFALPVRYAILPTAGQPGAVKAAEIGPDTITVDRPAPGGTFRQSFPTRAWRGVAVRMALTPDKMDMKVVLELLHTDPDLTLPLAVADEPADIVADWQAWASRLRLPLLLIEADGRIVEPVDRIGEVEASNPRPRRRHAHFAARRPRFLVRRKVGGEATARIEGREIIARN
jgi:hypothetical protein